MRLISGDRQADFSKSIGSERTEAVPFELEFVCPKPGTEAFAGFCKLLLEFLLDSQRVN